MDLAGKSVLFHVLDRVLRSREIDEIVVATTNEKRDDAIVEAVSGFGQKVTVFRGSEDDVLDRYFKAASQADADVVVRVTSDCPLIDYQVLDNMIGKFKETEADYLSNFFGGRTFPRGLDAEVFSIQALEKAWVEAKEPSEREHVTPYIWRNPKLFKCEPFKNPIDYSSFRWTLDEGDDYKLLKIIFEKIYPKKEDFLMEEVLRLIEEEPGLAEINAHVEQKKL